MLRTAFVSRIVDDSSAIGDGDDDGDENCNGSGDDVANSNDAADALPFRFRFFFLKDRIMHASPYALT